MCSVLTLYVHHTKRDDGRFFSGESLQLLNKTLRSIEISGGKNLSARSLHVNHSLHAFPCNASLPLSPFPSSSHPQIIYHRSGCMVPTKAFKCKKTHSSDHKHKILEAAIAFFSSNTLQIQKVFIALLIKSGNAIKILLQNKL